MNLDVRTQTVRMALATVMHHSSAHRVWRSTEPEHSHQGQYWNLRRSNILGGVSEHVVGLTPPIVSHWYDKSSNFGQKTEQLTNCAGSSSTAHSRGGLTRRLATKRWHTPTSGTMNTKNWCQWTSPWPTRETEIKNF